MQNLPRGKHKRDWDKCQRVRTLSLLGNGFYSRISDIDQMGRPSISGMFFNRSYLNLAEVFQFFTVLFNCSVAGIYFPF